MPIRDTNVFPSLAYGQETGIRNELVRREVEQDNELRSIMADYTMPGATPEAREQALNTLLAADPRAATQVMQFEQGRREMEIAEQIRAATEGRGMANFVLTAPDPVQALALIDDDDAVRQEARARGLNPEDPEDAIEIARMLNAEYDMAVGMGNDARVSAAIGDMRTLGYDLNPAGFRQYNEDRGTQGLEMLDGIQAQLAIESLRLQNEARERERVEAEDAARQERTAQQQLIERNIEQNRSAVELTQSLEGTMLESGLLASDFRRSAASLAATVGELTGRDTSELQQQIANFDTQRKILQDQVNARIASGDYGVSATQLQSIERSLASPNISPQAIIRIQGQLAQMDLDRADALEIELPNREEYETLAKEWKNYSPISVANIGRMTRQQLQDLDVDSLTDEQAEAALDRLRELQ